MKITLSITEQNISRFMSLERERIAASIAGPYHSVGGRSAEHNHLEGIAGEMAFCKFWNIYMPLIIGGIDTALPSAKRGTDHGDCILCGYSIDVKTTPYKMLIAGNWKKPGAVDYFALMTGTFPAYEFRGFMAEAELLRPARLRDLGHGTQTFVAEQKDLIMYLPGMETTQPLIEELAAEWSTF